MEQSQEKDIQDFILNNSDSRFQHTFDWAHAIEKAYKNCSLEYFSNVKKGKIIGLLPCLFIKSFLFGNKIISQPFCDFGGPVGKFDNVFIKRVLESVKEKYSDKIKFFEIRLNAFIPNYKKIEKVLLNNGFKKESRRQQIILKIEEENTLWEKFDRITRKGIKKAQKSALVIKEIDESELEKFYELYLKSMRDFGTPQHSFKYFYNLFNTKLFKGLNCYKDNKLIGSLIVFCFKDYIYAAYNFSEKKYLQYQPNDILYWEIIKWASNHGIKYFDFGQVECDAKKGTHAAGIYNFKTKWTGDVYDRPYFFYYFNKKYKGKKINNKKGKFEKIISIWKKMPLFIIKIIGPKIASQLAL